MATLNRPIECFINFNQEANFGSREHYFHFLLGYLLPGLHSALNLRDQEPGWERLIFTSCGPLMDRRIREACSLLGIDHSIRPAAHCSAARKFSGLSINAPRWDAWLRLGRPDQRCPTTWNTILQGAVARQMGWIRERLLTAAKATPVEPRQWLLLRRSAQPPFYQVGGAAEIPTYGQGRRSIANLNELAQQLLDAHRPVRVYEPGTDSFAGQIRAFHQAQGIICIRGAELANQIWMQPGSKVVMLATPIGEENHTAWNLSKLRKLEFIPIKVSSNHPIIEASQLLHLMG